MPPMIRGDAQVSADDSSAAICGSWKGAKNSTSTFFVVNEKGTRAVVFLCFANFPRVETGTGHAHPVTLCNSSSGASTLA